MKINNLLFLLLLFCFGNLLAQNNQLRNYTLEDGLPQSQVYDIIQDTAGYLWLATQGGGLARFDGNEFVIFREKDGLASNYIQDLELFGEGLLIATKKGLSIKNGDSIYSFKGRQANTVFVNEGVPYVGTISGIQRISEAGILENHTIHPTLDSAIINDIAFDGTRFWVASSKGLFKIDSLSNPISVENYDTSNFMALQQWNDTLFAATFTQGIVVIYTAEEHLEEVIRNSPTRINNLNIVNNQLWVSTDTNGISVLDAETFQPIRSISKREGLVVNHIRKSFLDRDGGIWIATSGAGLYTYFQNDFTHFDKDTGLQGNRVYAVQAANKDLYISTSESGISKLDSLGIHQIRTPENFSNVKIKTIAHDDFGNVLAGSDGKGVWQYRKTVKDSLIFTGDTMVTMRIDTLQIPKIEHTIYSEESGFPSDWIRQLVPIRNTLWVATYSAGIVKMSYDITQNKYLKTDHFAIETGIEDLLIRDSKLDEEGRLWYSTQNGHLGFIKNDQVTHLGDVLEAGVAINSIEFYKGNLFLGTAGNGIWKASLSDYPQFSKLSGAKELTSQNCYQLLFDTKGNLWAGSERGVDKIELGNDRELIDVFHFGRNDGFLGIETCLNASAIDEDGSLWFGALYGLTKYETSAVVKKKEQKPAITFEDVSVDFISVFNSNRATWITDSILELQPSQDQISFAYRTVDLMHPKDVHYRYQLDNKEWSPWTKTASQNLVGLNFGKHMFKVQSRNYRWVESEAISFPFVIKTPLYRQLWFQIFSLALAISIIGLLVYGYIRRLKNRNRKTQEELKLQNHLLSLEQKALRLQMNPHFIFNVLNGIKAMGSSNPQKMETTINTFAMMLREILNNSRKDVISLDQEIKTLHKYLEVEQLMARTPFLYEIKVLSEVAAEEILIPPMLVQPFVENAIKHGISAPLNDQEGEGGGSSRKGTLKVYFTSDEKNLYCTVTDNGPGIFESQKNKTATSHQSVALKVTKERIESLGGKGALELKQLEENGVILGTEVTFKIPLETDF
ncbi:MAG: ligand-binding sensor domain-containing protein [Patiriisocius sp.]|jgi:ligand-binding sensor domain-containing protein